MFTVFIMQAKIDNLV